MPRHSARRPETPGTRVTSSMSDYIVWIDCEMTGLDIERDELCEIACVVTNQELEIQDDGLQIVIKPTEKALGNMGEFVTNMHQESGLLDELQGGQSVESAAKKKTRVLAFVRPTTTDCLTTVFRDCVFSEASSRPFPLSRIARTPR
jgi:oligoribonuclease (3'-5' exoribonuclease)